MKLAILSESPIDEAVVRILVEGVLGSAVEPLALHARSGGWQSAVRIIPAVLKQLHYWRVAEGLVVVIDSDDSVVHHSDHDVREGEEADCRTCAIHNKIRAIEKNLKRNEGRDPIKISVAVPCPSIEAWLLCDQDPGCSEAGWLQRPKGRAETKSYIQSLKRQLYGSDRPDRMQAGEIATQAARRLAEDLPQLERLFPHSFGLFAQTLRKW